MTKEVDAASSASLTEGAGGLESALSSFLVTATKVFTMVLHGGFTIHWTGLKIVRTILRVTLLKLFPLSLAMSQYGITNMSDMAFDRILNDIIMSVCLIVWAIKLFGS